MTIKEYMNHQSAFTSMAYRQALILSREQAIRSSTTYTSIKPAALYLLAASDELYANHLLILKIIKDIDKSMGKRHLLQSANESTRSLLYLCLHLASSNSKFELCKFDTLTPDDLILAINALNIYLLDKYPYRNMDGAIQNTEICSGTYIPVIAYRRDDILSRTKKMIDKTGLTLPSARELATLVFIAGSDNLYCNANRMYDFKQHRLKIAAYDNPQLSYLGYSKDKLLGIVEFLSSSSGEFYKKTTLQEHYRLEHSLTINAIIIRYYEQVLAHYKWRCKHGKRS